MSKKKLCLVRQKRVLYPKNLSDYEFLVSLRIPFYIINPDLLALLSSRSKRGKFSIEIFDFDQIEESVFDSLKNKWPFGFELTGNSGFTLTVPNKSKALDKAEKLVEALKSFYRRHLTLLEVSSRKSSKNLKIKIQKKFDPARNPEFIQSN